MNILFIHQNAPGQFIHLIKKLASNHKVSIIGLQYFKYPQINSYIYTPTQGSTKSIESWLVDFESQVIRGKSLLITAKKLKDNGLNPDIIYFHPGWGEALFLDEIWPYSKKIAYCEYYYNSKNFDVGFDSEFMNVEQFTSSRLKIKNLATELQIKNADLLISPTNFQKSSFPINYRNKIIQVHDGINTNICIPNHDISLSILNDIGMQINLHYGDKLVTFINRNLEPYRGYHIFMRSLPIIMKEFPDLKILIIGNTNTGYGSKPENGNWKDIFYKEVYEKIDRNRIFYLGNISYENYIKVLQISMVHIYLTYPFVLSWSLLEAMSIGCAVIASNTAPVIEVIENNRDGILVDFFNYELLACKIIYLINNPSIRKELGYQSRKKIIDNYDLEKICIPRQLEILNNINENKY